MSEFSRQGTPEGIPWENSEIHTKNIGEAFVPLWQIKF